MSYLESLNELKDFGGTIPLKWKESFENIGERLYDWIVEPRDDTIKDLKLHIYGTETMSLDADITDYYVENNIAYQNHIALKPKVFTVSGEVGELTWFKQSKEESFLGAVPQKLTNIIPFAPVVSKRATAIQDKAMKVITVLDSLDNFANRLWGLLNDESLNTEQKKIYKYLSVLWEARTPINIQTPYGKVRNYIIKSVEFTQSDKTKDKSTIKISFKEFKTVIEKREKFDKKKLQGRSSAQKESKQQRGTTSGVRLEKNNCKPGMIYIDQENQMTRIVGGM